MERRQFSGTVPAPSAGMYHHVARGADGRLLFRTWTEGLALWDRLIEGVPGLVALTVMPDHFHLLHPHDVRVPLTRVAAGFARWRNAHRGEAGRVFQPLPAGEWLPNADRRRRTVRYVHLNPCRARLVPDPLAWPLSTHRDRVGLAAPRVVALHADPIDFHRRVSSDPTVAAAGTSLPDGTPQTDDLFGVRDAVSAVTRTPVPRLSRRGPARTLFLQAAAELCPEATRTAAGKLVGVCRETVWRSVRPNEDVTLVARALADPRFPALEEGDLREHPAWERYRGR